MKAPFGAFLLHKPVQKQKIPLYSKQK